MAVVSISILITSLFEISKTDHFTVSYQCISFCKRIHITKAGWKNSMISLICIIYIGFQFQCVGKNMVWFGSIEDTNIELLYSVLRYFFYFIFCKINTVLINFCWYKQLNTVNPINWEFAISIEDKKYELVEISKHCVNMRPFFAVQKQKMPLIQQNKNNENARGYERSITVKEALITIKTVKDLLCLMLVYFKNHLYCWST